MRRVIALGAALVFVAGCGSGRVNKQSDVYVDGEACGQMYALTYNEKTLKPTPLSEAVVLCGVNESSYKDPGDSGNGASYVAGVKNGYRQAWHTATVKG